MPLEKKRVIAYYDGSNFYHDCLDNYGIKKVNFFDMTNQLLNLEKEQIVKIKYFNSPVNQQENPQNYSKQQSFFQHIIKTPFCELNLGRLVRRPLNKINVNCIKCGHQRGEVIKCPTCDRDINVNTCTNVQEKGVDIKIGISLLLDAINDKYDIALLFSSDADFTPAIKYIISHIENKHVVYCRFPYPKTRELIKWCSSSRLITKEMVEKSQITC